METEDKTIIEKYKKIIQEQKKAIAILAVIVFTIFSLFILVFLPPLRVAHFGINDPVKIAELENSYRATIAQVFGGLAIIIGLYYTWQRITIAENNLKVAQDNLNVSQECQVTERFTRAIDQLGNEKMEIRLGGIYALERIANESEKDYWPIIEILTAYIRKNSSFEVAGNKKVTHLALDIQANESTTNEVSEVRNISLDIQAILTVIGRRRHSYRDGEIYRINLNGTCLQEAYLRDAHLEGIILSKAHLKKADLTKVNLQDSIIHDSHFERTIFVAAHLERASFINAHLEGAVIWDTHLEGIILSNARLQRADFFEAHLEGGNLRGADLRRARIWYTDLEGADLEGADLQRTHLKGAKNLTIDQLSVVKTLYKAELDEELRIQLEEKYPALFEEPDDEECSLPFTRYEELEQ